VQQQINPGQRVIDLEPRPDHLCDPRQRPALILIPPRSRRPGVQHRLQQIDAAENAHAREIETLAHLHNPHAPAVTALRSRTLARFTELETERTTINTQLADLAKTSTGPGNPALLDALPLLKDLFPDAPPRLQQQLYEAFDLQALYKKNMHQVTMHVTITDSTPRAVAAIINNTGDHPRHTTPDPGEHAHFRIWHKPLCAAEEPRS
jgi:hypothetical protein